jgi:predicted dehydrogenase
MRPVRIGVVGVGHLGKEHARILSGLEDVELVGVVDVNAAQAETVALRCHTRPFTDYHSLLPLVDAAIIVTPTSHHHCVASAFLRRGIPLLVEKPLAPTLAEAQDLVDLANCQGVILQVGHIERFNPAFEDLQQRPLQPKYINGQRLGLFTGRSADIGAVLDLMIHDLDLVLALMRAPVRSVEAIGLSVLGGHEDMVQARIRFANDCLVDLAASRISLQPCRRMQLWGPEGFAELDFSRRHLTLVQPSDALARHRTKQQPFDLASIQSLKTDLVGRHLQVLELDRNQGDQLTRELESFVHCVRTNSRPRVTGEDGRDAVSLAAKVVQSIQDHGWNGDGQRFSGPQNLPPALGQLFTPPAEHQAA